MLQGVCLYRGDENKSLAPELGSEFQTSTTHSADSVSILTFIPGSSHKISARGLVVAGPGSGINMSIGLGPCPRGAAVVQGPRPSSSSVSAWHLTKDGTCDVFTGHTGSVIALAVTPAPLPLCSAYPRSRYDSLLFLLSCNATPDGF